MKQGGKVEYITQTNYIPKPERVLITTAPRDIYDNDDQYEKLLCFTPDGKIDSFSHHPQHIPDDYKNISRQRPYELAFLIENVPGPVYLELPPEKTLIKELESGAYDVLGISSFTWTLPWALKIAKIAKTKYGIKEVWMGGYGIMTPEPEIRRWVDRLFWGYSESNLLEAIGLAPMDISDIKHPEIIAENSFLGYSVKIGHLFWKRGCRRKCDFCADPVFHPGGEDDLEFNNIRSIIEHYKKQGCISLHMVNQEVNPFSSVGEMVTQCLQDNNLHFSMMTSVAAINAKGEDGIKKLKDRGLTTVQIGVESLTEKNLQRSKKAANLRLIEQTVDRLLKNRIRVNATYMICFEDDTEESILKSKSRLLDMGLTVTHFNIVIPMPGTPFFYDFSKKGLINDWNWSHWTGERLVWKHPTISPERARELLAELDSEVNSPLYNMNLRKQWDRAVRMRNRSPRIAERELLN